MTSLVVAQRGFPRPGTVKNVLRCSLAQRGKGRSRMVAYGTRSVAQTDTYRLVDGGALTSTTSTRMFLQGLQDLGYAEGRDLQITYRSSEGYQDRLPAAEGLVGLNPDVIVAAGLDAVVALRNVTQTMPLVSATLADAVHLLSDN